MRTLNGILFNPNLSITFELHTKHMEALCRALIPKQIVQALLFIETGLLFYLFIYFIHRLMQQTHVVYELSMTHPPKI